MNSKDTNCLHFKRLIRRKIMSIINKDSGKKKTESQVIQILNKIHYSLNIVNRYKENIIHISAANNCVDIIKCILQKHDKNCLERKNAFGWTPLMQAVRNENTDMVKFLLNLGVTVNDFSFLGMSVLSLACAISSDMFDILYNSCPSALEYAAHDDINPLCVAALKNDKELFLKLIYLNLDIRRANAFTHTMMKQSTEPEIVALAKLHLNSEDYWNDLSDIEDLLKDEENTSNSLNNIDSMNIYSNSNNLKTSICNPKICVELFPSRMPKHISNNKNFYLNLQPSEVISKSKNPISPILSYFKETTLPISPNTYIVKNAQNNRLSKLTLNVNEKVNITKKHKNESSLIKIQDLESSLVLRRCQKKRPPNLKLRTFSNDSNTTLSFTPQFSPTKSPNLPHDVSEDNIFDETTPTPPKYKTPPRGIMLDPSTTKLIFLLKRFGLKRHIPVFIEQEVDLDLFLTLTDKDLIEIGIDCKSERLILLSVINECKGDENKIYGEIKKKINNTKISKKQFTFVPKRPARATR